MDRAFLLLLIATFRSVHLYHIHPANYFAIKSGDDASWSDRQIADLDKGEVNSLGLALPSPEDVATAIDVALQQQSLDSASSVKNFVVSPFGTIEFEATPVGRKLMFYEHNNPLGSIERALIVTDAIVRAPHSVERMAAKSPMLTTSEIIAELCGR